MLIHPHDMIPGPTPWYQCPSITYFVQHTTAYYKP